MDPAKSSHERLEYLFGPFRLDEGEKVLLKDGQAVALTPKVYDTLHFLVRHAGRTVTREDLYRHLWPDAVVADANLTQNVWVLRKALEDQGEAPLYIETIPRRGYRFIAPVEARVLAEPAPLVRTAPPVEPAPPPEAAAPVPAHPPPRARWTLLAPAAALALGLAAWASSRAGRPPAEGPARDEGRPARRSVAVLGFKNHAGAGERAWMSTALAEMLNTELAVSERLRTVPGEVVARARAELALSDADALAPDTLARVRSRLGADVVVSGSYLEAAGRLRVDVRVQDARSGETVLAFMDSGSEAELLELVSRAGRKLRGELGAGTISPRQGEELRAALPSNPEAARLHGEGLARLRQFDARGAKDALEKALQVQPDHPLTHAALAEAWAAMGYDRQARAEAERAVALSRGLPREASLWIQGRQHEIAKDWPGALAAYETLAEFFPDNVEYGLKRAAALTGGGRGRDALAVVAGLRRLPAPVSEDPRLDLEEAAAAEAVSDFRRQREAAARAGERARATGAGLLMARARLAESWAAKALGDLQAAEALALEAHGVLQAAGDKRGAATALNTVAINAWSRGDGAAAERHYREYLRVCREIGDESGISKGLNNLALIDRRRGRLDAARRALEESLEIKRKLGDRFGHARGQNNLAVVLSQMGQPARARALWEEALATRREIGDRSGAAEALINLASQAEQKGDLEAAARMAEEIGTIGRETAEPDTEAYAFETMVRVHGQRGALEEARQAARQALELRTKIGEQTLMARTHVALADAEAESDHLAEAEAQAREAVGGFDPGVEQEDAARARLVLARILARAGKPAPAAEEASAARRLVTGEENPGLLLDLRLTDALVKLARGPVPAADLHALAQEASRLGLRALRDEARLAAARAEIAAGRAAAAREALQRLSAEARKGGFSPLARRADGLAAASR